MKLKYRFVLYKSYFEKGLSITNYVKYFIVLVGFYSILANTNIYLILGAMIGYAIICFCIGWGWYHWGFMLEEQEVNNNYNKFVKEMRKSVVLKKRKI